MQEEGDAFQILAKMKSEKRSFDLVILDPPAFARNKKQKSQALEAYIRLAKAGAQVASKILFAASCTRHVQANEFYDAVCVGIRSAGIKYEGIAKTGHAQDHPATFSEAFYLKSAYFNVGRRIALNNNGLWITGWCGVGWALKRYWVNTCEIKLRVNLLHSALAEKKIKPS